MKRLTGLATFLVGAIMASHSAQGQGTFIPNDLYLGFENQADSGTADYIINLGPASALIDSGSVVNLDSDFSLSDFTSSGLSGTSSAGIMGGVIGGSNGNTPSDLFLTELRTGGAGIATVPGSTAPAGLTRSQDNESYANMAQINAPAAGTGFLDTTLSWQTYVEPTYTSDSLYGTIDVNPDSPVSQSTVLYEGLWGTSNSSGLGGAQPFVYEGYFTLDMTGGTVDLSFTPVPEPSSFMISGAGGILVLLLRRRMRRGNA